MAVLSRRRAAFDTAGLGAIRERTPERRTRPASARGYVPKGLPHEDAMHVDKYLGLLTRTEALLARSFLLLADRQGRDVQTRELARLFAGWSQRHVELLEPMRARYGRVHLLEEPDRLRAALHHDPRVGPLGALRDVQDTELLAEEAHGCWNVLLEAARALDDRELLSICETCRAQTDRQLAWLAARIQSLAPRAVTSDSTALEKLRASKPNHWSAAALPDLAWAPFAAALLIAVVGLVGLVARQPLLLPVLGPSAYLVALQGAHPSSRAYNVFVGHLVGLVAGVAAVSLLGAWHAPAVLQAKALVGVRVSASVIAIVLAVVGSAALRAHHPPAGATALLVSLGAMTSVKEAADLMAGVLVVAVGGAALRRVRLGSLRARQLPTLPELTRGPPLPG